MTIRLLRGLHNPGLEFFEAKRKCVATIGNFDGVHLGHQAILHQVIIEAEKRGLPSLVVIFEPQPLEFFKVKDAPARLMRFREKCQALAQFELDYIFCLRFDEALSHLSAQEFIEKVLINHIQLEHLVVGDDFRFGGDRLGDYALLQRSGKRHNFTVENTPTVLCTNESGTNEPGTNEQYVNEPEDLPATRISSSLVRDFLARGEFEHAKKVLGRPYEIMGRVIHGQKLGRQLGFPTANITLQRVKAPFSGVYLVRLNRSNGQSLDGVANIGVKPTVGNFKPSLEVHLLAFNEDLYGEIVSVHFLEKLREEKKFNGIEELKSQINIDVASAKQYFDI